MFIQVPLQLPKSITLKLLKPSYFNCACLEASPTPSICSVSPYNLTSPDPNISPSGCVVIKSTLFLQIPSIHLSAYLRDSSLISVILILRLEFSKFYLVMPSILYFAFLLTTLLIDSFLASDFSFLLRAYVLIDCLVTFARANVCFILYNYQHQALR